MDIKGFEKPIFLEMNQPNTVIDEWKKFIAAATKTLDIAIYDFHYEAPAQVKAIVGALTDAAKRGVSVRIVYDHTQTTDAAGNKGPQGSDPAPAPNTSDFMTKNFPAGIQNLEVKPIAGTHLMHNKYMVGDGEAVWMGSLNFTSDAMTLQENNVLRMHSAELASHYTQDFEDLWKSGNIAKSGDNDYAQLVVGDTTVEVGFAPGDGSAVASMFVDAIKGAGTGTVWVSTMVLSSGPILGALSDFLKVGGTLKGIYDRTQMDQVEADWTKAHSDKLATWLNIKPLLVGKVSTPYTPTSKHDFMHHKVLVTDKVVLTGSFNLSRTAESNAENCVAIHSADLAKSYLAEVERLVKIYGTRVR
ncbi:MAG: phospholipase D-like domain-containing protein [Kofleriaceae bacterium]